MTLQRKSQEHTELIAQTNKMVSWIYKEMKKGSSLADGKGETSVDMMLDNERNRGGREGSSERSLGEANKRRPNGITPEKADAWERCVTPA